MGTQSRTQMKQLNPHVPLGLSMTLLSRENLSLAAVLAVFQCYFYPALVDLC